MRPGSFPPSLPAQLADALRRIGELERRSHTGTGVSTAFRGHNTRTMQAGFPAELTGVWESAGVGTAYPWKALALEADVIDNPDVQLTGTLAVTPDNNEDLAAGVRGWMETDPQAGGYVFIVDAVEVTPRPVTSPTTGEPLPAPNSSGISGWTSDTCLVMGVVDTGSGICSTLDKTQRVLLTGGPTTWNSTSDFSGTGSGGTGPVVFNRTTPTPTATIDGVAGFSLGPIPGGWLFEFNTDTLCGGAEPVECDNWFRAAFMCSACAVESGSYSTRFTNNTLTVGTVTNRFIVPPQTNAARAIRLCLSVPCAGGLSNLYVTLTAPDGTVYVLMSNPSGLTAQAGEIIFYPGASQPVDTLVQSSGTVYGVYDPDDDFNAYAGPYVGVWTLAVVNTGPCTAYFTCTPNLCFGAVSSGLSGFTLSASPTSGAAPLDVTLGATITGTPRFYSVDWGDGSPEAWYASPVGLTHAYSTPGSYEIVARAYGECGGYVEDSVVITVSPAAAACGSDPGDLILTPSLQTGGAACVVGPSYTAATTFPSYSYDISSSCTNSGLDLILTCSAGFWALTSSFGFDMTFDLVSFTASPFELVYDVTLGASATGDTPGTMRVTFAL